MLVLSRKTIEGKDSVTITTPDGYQIMVKLCRVCSSTGAIRLAFDAPQDVKILRSELSERQDACVLQESH